jgi:hypothetical protein
MHLRANNGKEPINLANPDDPRTKQYYQKLHAEIEASIAAEIEIYRSLTNYIFEKAIERKKEDTLYEETQRQAQEVMKINTLLTEAAQANPNDGRMIEELQKTLEKLHQHVFMLESQKTALSKNMVQCKSEVDLAAQAWVVGREKAVNNILNDYSDIISDPKLREKNGMIRGVDNKALGKEDFAKLLDKTASADLKAMAQALENHDDVTKVKSNAVAHISHRIEAASQDKSLSEKEKLQIYTQAAKAEGFLQHIRMLNDLGGGDVAPTEMLILMKRERLLGVLLKKMNDSTLKQDVEAFKVIHEKLNELDTCQKKMNKTDEEITQFRSLISDVEASINKLETQSKPENKR